MEVDESIEEDDDDDDEEVAFDEEYGIDDDDWSDEGAGVEEWHAKDTESLLNKAQSSPVGEPSFLESPLLKGHEKLSIFFRIVHSDVFLFFFPHVSCSLAIAWIKELSIQ